MTDEKHRGQKQKEKQDQELLDDEDLDELMVKTARSQIRSDYRRSLGCENSRRCMDLKKTKKDE
ncbi:hypothetical protein LI82_12350 [Methanococcoides methylutens]|uniref:Uncharacterized protein n=1 Tax=Methanococcoides methylutens TaxID=2226 RepID=A0A099SZZ9_METMT|nr:hypothetical protein [Methanococcoides methylutens]KGK98480.1 hypothetical protein LI82_12350 [Methanococcoides methylutens]